MKGNSMRKKRMTKISQIWIGALLIILSVLVGVIIFYTQAISPYATAKSEAIALAKAKTPVKTVKNFDITTTKTTTYSLIGLDNAGKALGVLIPAKSGEITVVEMADNQSELTEKTAKLTLYKGKVVWQKSDMTMYAFETGEKVAF